jgi:hypothetical protein
MNGFLVTYALLISLAFSFFLPVEGRGEDGIGFPQMRAPAIARARSTVAGAQQHIPFLIPQQILPTLQGSEAAGGPPDGSEVATEEAGEEGLREALQLFLITIMLLLFMFVFVVLLMLLRRRKVARRKRPEPTVLEDLWTKTEEPED